MDMDRKESVSLAYLKLMVDVAMLDRKKPNYIHDANGVTY